MRFKKIIALLLTLTIVALIIYFFQIIVFLVLAALGVLALIGLWFMVVELYNKILERIE